ncbi:MAG: hypothetical protein R2771_05710 [Saprospiraceae bacterium]
MNGISLIVTFILVGSVPLILIPVHPIPVPASEVSGYRRSAAAKKILAP